MFGVLNLPPLFCSKCGAYDTKGMTFIEGRLLCENCWKGLMPATKRIN